MGLSTVSYTLETGVLLAATSTVHFTSLMLNPSFLVAAWFKIRCGARQQSLINAFTDVADKAVLHTGKLRYLCRSCRAAQTFFIIGWRRSVVVSGVGLINEVNRHWARLVHGWVTVCGRVNHLGM